MHKHQKRVLLPLILALLLPPTSALGAGVQAPVTNPSTSIGKSYEQDFVVTAYYSPLPDQCCYIRGSEEADKELNGQGTHAADGTAVYPGMAAASGDLPYGTVIDLPGIGVFTVHDRGFAIVRLLDGRQRLDIWAGSGEEGLARALAFGVGRLRGTVYPPGSAQPRTYVDLSRLFAPIAKLAPFLVSGTDLLRVRPKVGDRGYSVKLLQERLHVLGYFPRTVATGFFGEETRSALERFSKGFGIGDSPLALSERAAAVLAAAIERRKARDPRIAIVERRSRGTHVLAAKKALRFLGYYRGRTTPVYGDALRLAIEEFQKDHGLIADSSSLGAGRIGPKTRAALLAAWRRAHVLARAERILFVIEVERTLAQRRILVSGFFEEGMKGQSVRTLQRFLVARALLAPDRVTGTFGSQTRAAVLAFQKSAGIVADIADPGAGSVGPRTLLAIRAAQRADALKVVRAKGLDAL